MPRPFECFFLEIFFLFAYYICISPHIPPSFLQPIKEATLSCRLWSDISLPQTAHLFYICVYEYLITPPRPSPLCLSQHVTVKLSSLLFTDSQRGGVESIDSWALARHTDTVYCDHTHTHTKHKETGNNTFTHLIKDI